MIEVQIKDWIGTIVRWERDNEGLRERVAQPYRPSGRNAHFRLPNGKKKCEKFWADITDQEILLQLHHKYSNFRKAGFVIVSNKEQNAQASVATDDDSKTKLDNQK